MCLIQLTQFLQFDHETGASIKSSGFVKEATMRDKKHVVVFILDGSSLNFLSNDVVKKLQEIKSLAIDRGLNFEKSLNKK